MLGVLALLVVPSVHRIWEPAGDVMDRELRSEDLGLLGVYVTELLMLSPFAVLGGYLGGRRTGGRLRDTLSAEPPR